MSALPPKADIGTGTRITFDAATVVIAHREAGFLFFDDPRLWEATFGHSIHLAPLVRLLDYGQGGTSL